MAVTAIPVPPSRSLSSRPRRLVASADASLPRAATKARLLVSIASLWCLVFFGIISLSLPPRIDEESNLTFSLHHQSGLIDHLNTTVTKKVKNKLIRRSVAEIRESLASPDAKEQAFKDESIDASATRDGEFQVGNESEPVTYHKWSDSLIWPCVNVESVLKPRATSDSHVEPRFLRALYLHNWTLDLGSDAYVAQTYTASMLQILHTAKSSFSRSLERSIPLEGKDYRVNPNKLNVYELVGIRIQIDNVTSRLEPAVDESYSIHIPHPEATSSRHSHDHWIHIHAATVYGARHGLETMKQLFNFGWVEKENDEAATPIALFTLRNATLYVKDSPAYPFRGLLIDTARHFLPLGLIHRNLQVHSLVHPQPIRFEAS